MSVKRKLSSSSKKVKGKILLTYVMMTCLQQSYAGICVGYSVVPG